MDDIVQHRVNIDARFGADLGCVLCGETDDLLDLVLDALRVGGRQVDLVDDGQNFEVVVEREIGVR